MGVLHSPVIHGYAEEPGCTEGLTGGLGFLQVAPEGFLAFINATDGLEPRALGQGAGAIWRLRLLPRHTHSTPLGLRASGQGAGAIWRLRLLPRHTQDLPLSLRASGQGAVAFLRLRLLPRHTQDLPLSLRASG